MSTRNWYAMPVAAACAAIAAVAGAAYLLTDSEYGPREVQSRSAIAVTIRHYGIDAREIERSITIPLEDALASAAGVSGVSSSSEYGKARVVVRFESGAEPDSVHEAVRDATERVYLTLPASVQRPELETSSEGRGPVWVAAVYSGNLPSSELGTVLERSVKPALEKLAGAGEVELAGTGLPEITVEVDEAAAAVLGIDAGTVARTLAMNDVLIPAGTLRSEGRRLAVVADGRHMDAGSLADESIVSASGKPVALGAFCRIREGTRTPETLSRVDGKPALTVAVNPGGRANLPALSRALALETEALADAYGIRFEVLSDAGSDIARSFRSTLFAALQGALAVALASALLIGRGNAPRTIRAKFVAVIAVPIILAISAATLSALGFSLDRHVLAGLAVGLGASVDSAILAAERLGTSTDVEQGVRAMRALTPSLASGAATTLVVLVPLAGLDFLSEGVARVALAIAVVCIVSLLYTLCILPPLMLGGEDSAFAGNKYRISVHRFSSRKLFRLLARNALICARKPLVPLAAAMVLGIAGFGAVLVMPLESRELQQEDTVYAHLEFEAGTSVSGVDMLLAEYSEALAGIEGFTSIQSTARRGSGSVTVSFDPELLDWDRAAAALREVPVSGGFVWIPGSSAGERSWELVVSGDDDRECERLCLLAAQAVSAVPCVFGTVLNFKDGPLDLVLSPDRDRAASLGLGMQNASAALRTSIHGPVAYKRLGQNGEIDVRVMVKRSGVPETSDAQATLVHSAHGGVRVDSFMGMQRSGDASRINRRDRQRIASITMRTGQLDPRAVKSAVLAAVAGIELSPGYRMEFDREAVEATARLRGAGWSFLLAAAYAYMVTAAVTESFGAPLAVLSALPPSLAVPALLLFITRTPLDATVACAFVAVSGMVVNASVLTVDERRSRNPGGKASAADLYRIMRARFGSLAATSGTTVAGALPLLFLSDSGSAMVRSLAFVAATGTAASFVMALTMIPALASVAPSLFRRSESTRYQIKGGRLI